MAERRMFSKRIASSAKFLKMPVSSQCLYFHLGLHADDDGIVEAYTVINSTGASENDIKILVSKGFVCILNEDLVSYITDWNENNKIRADRKKESIYKDLLVKILPDIIPTSKTKRSNTPNGNQMATKWQPTDNQMTAQDRLGKVSIGKDSIGECIECSAPQNTKPTRHKYGEYKNVLLSDEEFEKLKEEFHEDWESRIERLSEYIAISGKSYKNHLATIRKWSKADAEKKAAEQKKAETISTKSSKSKFNNYTDTNKPDYSSFSEQIISDMLTEQARKETNNESKQDNF